MLRLLRASLAGPALGALALAAILVLLQRPAPLFVNVGAGDDDFARGFRAWERDGLRASGETMFRWALDGARVELPLRVRSGSLIARLRLARFTDRPAGITLLSSGRQVDQWTQPPRGWRERTVELGEVRGPPVLQLRTTPEGPEGLAVALDWVELRGAGRVLPSPRLFAGLALLFLGVPSALRILAGPAPALGAAAATAVVGIALVAWDRLGGVCALGAAGAPALVGTVLLAALFRLQRGVGARSVDEGHDWKPKLGGVLHQTQRFAVSLRSGHAEPPLHPFLGGAALLVADGYYRAAIE